MSIGLVSENKNPLPFIGSDPFGNALSFLKFSDLTQIESVCRDWRACVESTHQWKGQCERELSLFMKRYSDGRPLEKVPYKKIFQSSYPQMIGEDMYRRYLGEIGKVPPIPESFSFGIDSHRDPCDPNQTIGTQYVRLYIPPYIEMKLVGYIFNQPDDSGPEAPMLMREYENESEKVLKVPVTLYNLLQLFSDSKMKKPFLLTHVSDEILERYGHQRAQSGWVCIRRNVLGQNMRIRELEALVEEKKVIATQLLHRVLFHFFEYVRSSEVGRLYDTYTFGLIASGEADQGNFLGCIFDPLCLCIIESLRPDSDDLGVYVSLPESFP